MLHQIHFTKTLRKRRNTLAFIASVVLMLDLLTKYFFTWVVLKYGELHLTSFFSIISTWNYGISFGLFNNALQNQLIFVILSLTIIYFLLVMIFQEPHPKKSQMCATGLIIGGALGNIVNRITHGAVIDFISVHYGGYYFPAFNVADAMIFIGAMLWLFSSKRRR